MNKREFLALSKEAQTKERFMSMTEDDRKAVALGEVLILSGELLQASDEAKAIFRTILGKDEG